MPTEGTHGVSVCDVLIDPIFAAIIYYYRLYQHLDQLSYLKSRHL